MMQQVGQQNKRLHQKMAELEKACQSLGAQLKTANILLNMDDGKLSIHFVVLENGFGIMRRLWRGTRLGQRKWPYMS
ncbi:hypothetical protein V6N13_006330 [Hibiscus sabdariffa]|uniref:Uncharacterized protein n=1 Tax=Hibiscus sabdariffa TaxID=183260 RepID=A0ABR2EN99_9ROSI